MKSSRIFLLSALAASLFFGGTGCEMHPPTDSAHGHGSAEKHEPEKDPRAAEGSNPDAPAYFPSKE